MSAPHYEHPESVVGTVFDPSDETFGPIMRDLQAGDFESALAGVRGLVHFPVSTDPQTAEEKKEYLFQYANFAWNIGTMLEDRRGAHGDPRIWDYVYESLDEIYELSGKFMDEAEDVIFGEESA